jgi:type IV pilus assembly protein PilV
VVLGTDYPNPPTTGAPTCTSGTSALQQAQAVGDLTAWNNALLGSAEAVGGTKFGAMIGARGCITQTDAVNNVYRVSVAWQGLASTTAPPADTCGQNTYGTEAQRRVVNVTLRIGKLS